MFRTARWVYVVLVIAEAMFVAGAVGMYRAGGWTWVSITLALMTFVGLGGIAEALVRRIELTDDAMLVRDLFSRKRYARTEIERIQVAKGVAPVLVLRDGRIAKLPSLEVEIANPVRAWLRSGR